MIPEGWKEETIRELLNQDFLVEVQDGNHGNEHPKSSDYVKEGVPFIMARDLAGGTINFSSCSFISPEQAKNLRIGFSYPNDILLSHKGTIGEVARVPNNYDYIILTPQVTCYRVNSKANFSSDFLYQYFLFPEFQSVLKAWSSQSTRNYIGITQQKNLIIKYPPLPEQRKIAEILGAWDEAIALLEKLITAKRKLKQGLMQQLLTGKKRFKEFEGSEWKSYSFSDIAELRSKKFNPKTNPQSKICIELEHISQVSGQLIGMIDSSQQSSTKNLFFAGDVLFGKLRPYLKKYWLAEFEGVCSTEIWVLISRKFIIPNYLFYLVQTSEFIAISNVSSGSKMPRADWEYVSEVSFILPPLPEQQKIASVLSAADAEISTLEKQLAAYKQQKRGLMQQLLTGKTRVRVN